MEAFVYSWSDNKTAKIYVGVHKGSQTDGYICSSKPMMAQYRERPTDFTRQIIATGTLNDCAVLEVAIIKQLLKNKDTCYNRAAGKMIINDVHPMLGKKQSDNVKEAVKNANTGRAAWNKGKTMTPEYIEKNRQSHLGLKASDEAKAKMSESRKGEKHPLWGKKHSEETRRKQGAKNIGKVASEALRKLRSENQKEWWRKKKEVLNASVS
jgi:hypothetical protein